LSMTLQYDAELAKLQNIFAKSPDLVGQRAAIRQNLGLKLGERVLEIGSGNGALAAEMAIEVGKNGNIAAADISTAMVAFARLAHPDYPNLSFIEADAADLPFADGSFDAATGAQCLCLVDNVDKALAELWRVLRPGGRVTILDTDWGTLVWNSRNLPCMQRVMDAYVSVYPDPHLPRSLGRALENAGFVVGARDVHVIVNWQSDPNSFSGQTVSFIREFFRGSEEIAPAEIDLWQDGIDAAARDGTYFFSLNRYIFTAVKPEC
jgi:arsenite methyltransferase